jgi:hypothetical protein
MNPQIVSAIVAGTTASLYQEGAAAMLGGDIDVGQTTINAFFIGGGGADGSVGRFDGAFAEVIVFNSALSTADRARVESYLATKWGISGVHKSAADETAAVAAPTELAGCSLWLDASDASSITASGGLVSQWNDKSGNNRHATSSGSLRPTHGGSQNGRTVMQFTGTQGLTINGNFLQLENVTMFAVAAKNADHFGGIITSAPTNPEDSPLLTFWGAFIAFVCRRQVVQSAAANGVYRLLCGQSIGTTQRAHFEGVQGTDGVASAALNTTNTVTKIGPVRTSGSSGLNGNIAEIVCYSGNLSTTDRARVEKYLAQKWGIANVPDPTPPVGQWRDKSGNDRHATQATGGSRPTVSGTTLNGRRQLSFVSQHLRGPESSWNGSATIYWAGRTGQSANGAFVFHDGEADQPSAFHAGWLNAQGVGAYGNGWNSGNAPRAESPNNWRLSNIVAGVTLSSSEAIARVNGATVNTTAALTGTLSQSTSAQPFIGRDAGNIWNNLNGTIAELLIFQPALTAAQRLAVERYLGSKWSITLAPQVSNADAQSWINSVYANGGTVSASTASAVNTLCNSIDAAGIRDRFYRLGIFAGSNLAASLVPLYRGPSLGGTQFGNVTDTNSNFVSGDFAETGATGGLTGNGTNKHLATGVLPDDVFSQSLGHLSYYGAEWNPSTTANPGSIVIGALNAAATNRLYLLGRGNSGACGGSTAQRTGQLGGIGLTNCESTNTVTAGHYLVSRTSGTAMSLYKNAQSLNSSIAANTYTSFAEPIRVFAAGLSGGTLGVSAIRLMSYSIGHGMTSAQATAYYDAMQAFQTALGRNV